ncbi:MAG TPA: ABC transporter substrate binding protein [Thauera sp.]|nr:ABC transporter substrate binding protein [Thauera sp.]
MKSPIGKQLAAALLALTLTTSSMAADIFLIASYHETDACGQPQYEAAMDALKQGGFASLSSKGYFLDSRVAPKEEVAKAIEQIRKDIRAEKPKLVFTIDDTAFAMLYEEVLQQPETKMVFSGLNRKLDYYNDRARFLNKRSPVANITGVFEYLFMHEQLALLEAVLERPLRKVAVLYSTDAVGVILKDQIVDELKGTPYENQIVLFSADDIPTMISNAKAINDDEQIDAYVPVTMSVLDPADNKRKTMSMVAPTLIKTIRKIDLSLNSSFTEYGFFGGVSIDFYQMGFQTGFLATKLLKGGAAKEISVEDAKRSIIAVNRTRMQELGIELSPEARSIVDKWIQ